MIDATLIPWLLAGIPLLGAILSPAFWAHPHRLMAWSVGVSAVSLASVAGFAGSLTTPPEGLLLLFLLPLAAGVSLLGQPHHQDHRASWVMTLLFLSLGLGALASRPVIGKLFLLAIHGFVIVLLYRHHTPLWPISWWGLGAYTLGALCLLLTLVAAPPLSSMAALLACTILLPVVPFHDGHLTALTRLPGNLPSFMVLLFPALGLHSLAPLAATLPDTVAGMMSFLALAGTVYGAVKALAQSRVRLLLAYSSLSFFSMLWWCVVTTRSATPRAALFVGAVGLVMCGLLLAWQIIRTRYGDDVDPQAISGLASTMPQYAVLLSLLALAAMGLPPFGVFAGFMGLLLSSTAAFSAGIIVLVSAWLSSSWYILDLVQRLLFGTRRSDLRYADLLQTELASLVIVVLTLLALGVVPVSLFGPDRTPAPTGANSRPAGATSGSLAWNR
ncbi:MAG TPA: proton-conducting transporter membrane subunit [Nitrospira sp.]|nr:proton-conducting transporter membrane subunit [Nitrospira sp.]